MPPNDGLKWGKTGKVSKFGYIDLKEKVKRKSIPLPYDFFRHDEMVVDILVSSIKINQ